MMGPMAAGGAAQYPQPPQGSATAPMMGPMGTGGATQYPQPPPGAVAVQGPYVQGPYTHQPPGSVPAPAPIIAGIRYGREPITMKCFHCEKQITTSTSSKPGAMG